MIPHLSGGSHATVTEGDRPWPLFYRCAGGS